jgi:hypothetical protein
MDMPSPPPRAAGRFHSPVSRSGATPGSFPDRDFAGSSRSNLTSLLVVRIPTEALVWQAQADPRDDDDSLAKFTQSGIIRGINFATHPAQVLRKKACNLQHRVVD